MAVVLTSPDADITIVNSVKNIFDGALLIHEMAEKKINEIQKTCAECISEYVLRYNKEYDNLRGDIIDLLRHLDHLKEHFKDLDAKWLNMPGFDDNEDGSFDTTVGITTDIVTRYQKILVMYNEIKNEIAIIEQGFTRGMPRQRLFIDA